MATLFCSYSHADEDLRNELEKQLAVIKNQGFIDIWHDRRITVGQTFGTEIERHLEGFDIILLLFSPDFLSSDYCYQREATRALERHDAGQARTIPVILHPCDWTNTPFAKLLAAPRDGKPVTKWPDRDEAFLDVVRMIRKAVEELNLPPMGARQSAGRGAAAPLPQSLPRSSNMRLARSFTDHDKDRFVDEAFDYITSYFENSLEELRRRNTGVETDLKKVDARSFEAAVYISEKSVPPAVSGRMPTGSLEVASCIRAPA